MQVGGVFVFGIGQNVDFFLFAVFGTQAVQRLAVSVIDELAAAAGKARLRLVFVAAGFHIVAVDFAGSGVIGAERVQRVEQTVGFDG